MFLEWLMCPGNKERRTSVGSKHRSRILVESNKIARVKGLGMPGVLREHRTGEGQGRSSGQDIWAESWRRGRAGRWKCCPGQGHPARFKSGLSDARFALASIFHATWIKSCKREAAICPSLAMSKLLAPEWKDIWGAENSASPDRTGGYEIHFCTKHIAHQCHPGFASSVLPPKDSWLGSVIAFQLLLIIALTFF